ncbi:MAG: permease-like cell division protein FtsX [Clostridium sp.]|nr:permease-like cell division protein FtsX [Clostridium sp.]
MKKINLLGYSIVQGFKNLKRNRMFSLASIGTITACLFLFGIFYAILVNFQFIINNAETSVGVTVFFDKGITDEQIEEIGTQIKSRPEVIECNYISPEQAWENFKDEVFNGQDELTDTFSEDNPLAESASYEIFLNDIDKQQDFVSYTKTLDGVRQVNSADNTVKSLSSFNKLVGYASAVIIIILIAVSVFLISTAVTMGISIRREEIRIMRMVGASDFFIRAPFIIEGIIIGIVGAAIPLAILYVLYQKIIGYVISRFDILNNLLTFMSAGKVFETLIPVSFVIGIGIGFVGSFITVRKHLKV